MEEPESQSAHPFRRLALVLAALLCLTAIAVAVATIPSGAWRIWIALAIASIKASLVLLYFMDLRSAGRLIAVTGIITLAILALFIGFIFWDVAYR